MTEYIFTLQINALDSEGHRACLRARVALAPPVLARTFGGVVVQTLVTFVAL